MKEDYGEKEAKKEGASDWASVLTIAVIKLFLERLAELVTESEGTGWARATLDWIRSWICSILCLLTQIVLF